MSLSLYVCPYNTDAVKLEDLRVTDGGMVGVDVIIEATKANVSIVCIVCYVW